MDAESYRKSLRKALLTSRHIANGGPYLWTDAQIDLGKCIIDHQYNAWTSAHGTGKSHILPHMAVAFAESQPNSQVIITGSGQDSIRSTLWRHIEALQPYYPALIDRFFYWKMGDGKEIRAIASNRATNYTGQHRENLLIIIDEASRVEEWKFDALDSNMTSLAKRMVASGNPYIEPNGGQWFHNAISGGKGWNVTQLSALDHPNITTGEILYPGMTTQHRIDKVIEVYGENSDMFRIQVLGKPPLEQSQVIIPYKLIDPFVDVETHMDGYVSAAGMDIGGNETGEDLTLAYTIDDIGVGRFFRAVEKSVTADTAEGLGHEVMEVVQVLTIDGVGIGDSPAVNMRNSYGNERVIIFKSNHKSTQQRAVERASAPSRSSATRVTKTKRANKDWKFHDLGAEAYFDVQKLLKYQTDTGQIFLSIPGREELLDQLPKRRFIIRNGRLALEEKEDMKKRNEQADHSDAWVHCVHGWLRANPHVYSEVMRYGV